MPRDWYIAGNVIVKVVVPSSPSTGDELGLAEDAIRIAPDFHYMPIHCDAYGGMVPVEKLWMLGQTTIDMTLVHYNAVIVEFLVKLGMAGSLNPVGQVAQMGPAGTPMGGNAAVGVSPCNYFKLIIEASEVNSYIFPFCHLAERPITLPLGSMYSKTHLSITSLPYATADDAGSSEGNSLWERS